MIIISQTEGDNPSNINRRIIACFIDYGLIFTFVILVLYVFGNPNGDGGYSMTGWSALTPMFI